LKPWSRCELAVLNQFGEWCLIRVNVPRPKLTPAGILQTPVNWFGAPWIYKKYVDEVFNAGLNTKALLEGDGRTRKDSSKQYGTGGKMQGRKFMISATWNAPRETYDNPNSVLFGGKGTADLLLHITSNYKFCGYDILPDFGVFDIFKNPNIPRSLEDYKRHLEKHCL
jgi:modulator of drug activity B